MKSVTEFPIFVLNRALQARTSLTSEGKSPEEIQQNLGETFKYEGDKLKYFTHALEVAGQNAENLKRIVVISLGEGESAPPKAKQVEELYYVPEFYVDPKAAPPKEARPGGRGGRRGGGGGRGDKKDSSPWGLSPEQKAAKKGGPPKAN